MAHELPVLSRVALVTAAERTSDSTAISRFSSSKLMRHHSRKYTVLMSRGVDGTMMAVCCAVVKANSCCQEDMSDAKNGFSAPRAT